MPDCELPSPNPPGSEIAEILRSSKVIAVVGLSPKPERPSHGVSAYMKDQGYRIIPVNPGHPEILGEKAYRSLLDVPGPIDIVNVFRDSSAVPEIVDQAIEKKAKVVWLQEGIIHNEAAEKARKAGIQVIQNKCIYKEHAQL